MTLILKATATACYTIRRNDNMKEIKITKDNFEKEVLQSDIPVLVDFWAAWCGPCQMVAPTVAEIADEYDGKIKVGKVNVDEEMELSMKFQISSIPALLVFKDGKMATGVVGAADKNYILNMING